VVVKVAEALSDQEVREQLNGLLRDLGEAVHKLEENVLERKKRVKAVNDWFEPEVTKLENQIESLKSRIKEVAKPRFMRLVTRGTKTIQLSYGEISHRVNPASLVIENEKLTLNWLRRHRLLKKFTKVGKRTINNKALKEALDRDPALATQIQGAQVVRGENFVIKPGKTKAEITISVEAGSLDTQKED
jgi:phage host-nuclease inhibitor protein Gam